MTSEMGKPIADPFSVEGGPVTSVGVFPKMAQDVKISLGSFSVVTRIEPLGYEMKQQRLNSDFGSPTKNIFLYTIN